MLFAIGAASSAIDLLKSLTSSNKTSSTQAAKFGATASASSSSEISSPAPISGAPAPKGNVSPQTMSALLDAQSQSSATSSTPGKSQSKALKDLFNLIDGNGDGSVTKSEFTDALGAGGTNTANADSVFNKLDSDGSGSVSLDELSSALKGKGRHRHDAKQAGESAQVDPLLKALDEANAAQEASRAASSYTTTDQAVQRMAQTKAAANASIVSVSA